MIDQCIVTTPDQIRSLVGLDKALHTLIEDGFKALETENCIMPPVLGMTLEDRNGEVDVKTAYWPSKEYFAIKVSPGFFSNPALGLPSLNGLMVLLSSTTGQTAALLVDNGYLTDIRTAAAGGVAARHLAGEGDSLGVIGAGVQARLQLQSFLIERPIKRVNIWARSNDSAEQFAAEVRASQGVEVCVSLSCEALVKESQSIITTTPSRDPLIKGEWLTAGHHITAMGSDAPEKRELDDQVLEAADLMVVDRRQQSETRGELNHYAGDVTKLNVTELPALLVKGYQRSSSDITVADLTGTGIQDTAIANYVFQLLKDREELLRIKL